MSLSFKETCKLYLEYSKDNLLDMITQILKSPDLISDINRLPLKDIKKIKKDIEGLADQIIEKEASYYIKKYKLKNTGDFVSLFERLSAGDLKNNRKKIVQEMIKEKFEK